MEKETFRKLLNTNLLPLAFVGDSVHTLYIREHVLSAPTLKIENYHTITSKHCKAAAQAKALEAIMPILNEEEQEIVRRGRNAKPKHQAKNASSAEYSFATAFEVLIGWLYLSNQQERLQEILKQAAQAVEKGN